jgi:hypothetical protein
VRAVKEKTIDGGSGPFTTLGHNCASSGTFLGKLPFVAKCLAGSVGLALDLTKAARGTAMLPLTSLQRA